PILFQNTSNLEDPLIFKKAMVHLMLEVYASKNNYDKELFKKLISGIIESPDLRWGMKVQDFFVQPQPDFSYQNEYFAASPIFIKRTIDKRQKHYLYSDKEANDLLKETLIHKLKIAGIKVNDFCIRFNENDKDARTSKVAYNGIGNKANICSVLIEGDNTLKQFAWNVGLGNSTGIGFGAIQ
ncbi:MAG: CRISPR-associated endoribonuclease Cas6, partial [Salinivirgaceae bacterium]|nr:CRISPR-associated endoribonuclease Cas6 [Salinivirgaceae bacterium]